MIFIKNIMHISNKLGFFCSYISKQNLRESIANMIIYDTLIHHINYIWNFYILKI